jgi:hypothetical protein
VPRCNRQYRVFVVVTVSGLATARHSPAVTVTSTVAVAVPPLPSLT